jgi:hypothetical protein
VVALGCFAIAAGFAVATLKTALIDPPIFDRPWAPRPARTASFALSDTAADPSPALRLPPRDAMPRPEDLQPDD